MGACIASNKTVGSMVSNGAFVLRLIRLCFGDVENGMVSRDDIHVMLMKSGAGFTIGHFGTASIRCICTLKKGGLGILEHRASSGFHCARCSLARK